MHRPIRPALLVAGAFGLALAAAPRAGAGLLSHFPARHAKPAVATNEGPWFVRAGEAQDLYANVGRKPLPLQIYLCTRAEGLSAPRVQHLVLGRAAVDVQG